MPFLLKGKTGINTMELVEEVNWVLIAMLLGRVTPDTIPCMV